MLSVIPGLRGTFLRTSWKLLASVFQHVFRNIFQHVFQDDFQDDFSYFSGWDFRQFFLE